MATAGIRQRTEPQFFKPMLPPFQQLSIPRAFLKYLVDEMCEGGVGEATLKNHRKSWRVKVKGFCFTEGWNDFVLDNDLGFGDVVVFRYEGAMVFDVLVFDRSCCEKQYHYPPATAVKVFDRSSCEKQYHHPPATPVERESQKQQERDDSLIKEEEIEISSPPSERVTTPCNEPKATQDSFEILLTQNNTRKCQQASFPRHFARANGLVGKIFKAIFRDEKGRSWSVRLNQYSRGRVRFGVGWLEFLSGNHLKEGDSCVFKLVNCQKICRGVSNAIVLDVTVSTSSSSSSSTDGVQRRALVNWKNNDQIRTRPSNPSFETSLRPFNFKNSRLSVPRHFALANGLMGKSFTMTLRDRKGRSWRMQLKGYKRRLLSIHGDWDRISAVNGLKEGDTCNFELIRRGKLQVMEFHLL